MPFTLVTKLSKPIPKDCKPNSDKSALKSFSISIAIRFSTNGYLKTNKRAALCPYTLFISLTISLAQSWGVLWFFPIPFQNKQLKKSYWFHQDMATNTPALVLTHLKVNIILKVCPNYSEYFCKQPLFMLELTQQINTACIKLSFRDCLCLPCC